MWEANHVWLIFCFVVLWTCFAEAYESIWFTLFVPLTRRKPMITPFTAPADQIVFAVADLQSAISGWQRLGIGPWTTPTSGELSEFVYRGQASAASVHVASGWLGTTRVELINPTDDEPSSYRDAIGLGATALHNLSWNVADLDAAANTIRGAGGVVRQSGSRDGRRFVAFEPTVGTGTITELIESTEETSPPTSGGAGPFSPPPDQLGFAVPDLDKAVDGWLQIGVGPWLTLKNAKVTQYRYRGESSKPKLDVAFAQLGSLQLEVIQPANDARSSYRDFVESGAEGLQHIAWFVDDLDAATKAAIAQGGTLLQEGAWAGVHFAYFEPADGNGTITELIGMTDLSREMFAMIAEKASVPDWDGETHPSRNVLLAADWGLRWDAVRAELADLVHRD